MNQQRSRRFRSALDAKNAAEKAVRSGLEMPAEPPFDSNCITPGTPFMMRLQQQLMYFINKKISEDSNWKLVQVILSGHDTPGEGEHKIQEYIRLCKSNIGYNENTRHCIYGLDADLMMLGLASHEPHFSLLREEVTFGRKNRSGVTRVEQQAFYLFHISIFREYLDLEFSSLRDKLDFPYNLENIIDDYILMNFFLGNDFLANIPGFGFAEEGSLSRLFDVYKEVLPSCGGYINENGNLNLERFSKLVGKLSECEKDVFRTSLGDASWLKSKSKGPESSKPAKFMLHMTPTQKEFFILISRFVLQRDLDLLIDLPWSTTGAKNRIFLTDLIAKLDLSFEIDGDMMTVGWPLDFIDDIGKKQKSDDILQMYESAPIFSDKEVLRKYDTHKEAAISEEFETFKRGYYKEKLEIDYNDKQVMQEVAHTYVEGIQWVLSYYYHGVPSWSWFYPRHYSPRISDLVGITTMEFKFVLGHPFFPFEQLMGVLPPLSQQHVPESLRVLDIMTIAANDRLWIAYNIFLSRSV